MPSALEPDSWRWERGVPDVLKLRKIRRRHHTLAYALLAFLAFAVAVPAVLGSRGPALGLAGDAVLAAISDSYTLSAPVPLIRSGALTLDRGTLSLAAVQPGPLRNGEAVMKMLLGGSARLNLDGAAITFAAAAPPRGQTTASGWDDPLSPLLSALLDSRFEQVSLRDATVDVVRADGTTRRLEGVNALINAKRNGTVTASGSFVYLSEPLKFDMAILLGDRSSSIRLPMRAHIRGQLIEASITEGRVSVGNGFELSSQHATITVPDLRKAARWLGTAWPDGPGLKNARIDGTLDLVSQSLAFQRARIELDGNEASGALLVNLGGGRPGIEGTLALQKLDVTRYLPSLAMPPDSPRNLADSSAKASESGAFVFPVLRHFDADLRLSANKVQAGQLTLGRSAAALSLRAGRLAADIAEIEIDGQSRGNGQFNIDMSEAGPRFALRTRLSNIDSEAVAGALFGRALVRGRGDLSLDLAGTGTELAPLMSSLSGKAGLRLIRGGSIAIDIPALLAGAQSKPADEVWGGVLKGQTQLDELDAGCRITQGIWTTESVIARSGNALLTATGLIDAPAGEVDVVITRSNAARPVDLTGPAAQGTAAHVRGPWTNPRVQPANRPRKAS